MRGVVVEGAEGRLAYIDTLRGLAAVYVLLFHTALMPAPPLAVPPVLGRLILNGGTGVTLFFVVSAFTLCLSMASRADEPHALRRYFIRRAFRIIPLFYVWVVLSWLRDAMVLGVYHPAGRVLLNAAFLYNFVPGEETSFVWAGWTLGVEVIFYVVFPLIFGWVTSVSRALALVAASIALGNAHAHLIAWMPVAEPLRASYLQFSVPHMLPVFAFGILAFNIHSRWFDGRPPNRLVSLALVVSACVGYWALLSGHMWGRLDSLYWQAIVYATLLLGLSVFSWPVLVNRVTVFLGVISYSLYLNHPTVVAMLRPFYRWVYAGTIPASLQFAVCASVTVTAVAVGSILSYRVVEQPGIRLGSRLIRRWAATAAVERA